MSETKRVDVSIIVVVDIELIIRFLYIMVNYFWMNVSKELTNKPMKGVWKSLKSLIMICSSQSTMIEVQTNQKM